MYILRSIIFNIVFYALWTPLICISMMPALLFPRGFTVWVSRLYQNGAYILAKIILGIDYEIRGIENQPANGVYLVASKHQSAYETLVLFRLFKDPTIILKKELLSLPLFGWFLRKLEVIAIDRGNSANAKSSLYEGAKYMRDQKRPIVIFPQGTRVKIGIPSSQKPYKGGIVKLYSQLDMPILPVALNTGLYWPRNSFWKYPGKIVFEFLPLIPPGLPSDEVLKKLETNIESASNRLIEEGRQAQAK